MRNPNPTNINKTTPIVIAKDLENFLFFFVIAGLLELPEDRPEELNVLNSILSKLLTSIIYIT